MQSLVSMSFADPTEIREFPHGRLELFDLHGSAVGRFVLEPGWHWSRDVGPLAGTESCQQRHVAYLLSGNLHVAMNDGSYGVVKAGEVVHIEPGHDAWTVGEDTVTILDFADVATYAVDTAALRAAH
ncbi:hypothetical protein SAMN04487819_108119 [Actinopolyspora alba]|uniref:Cupin domain-containing protein n=1 Tax=Actinopolyspora alba TaxID=673379 RepID=A0A1I1Y1V7_9ACTN|nr:cupin domain-containing protein [Actinopolyspora alba]SFE13647.1 hypothetical protein SAMN04487819_108119 [Actinopolyspora alba]